MKSKTLLFIHGMYMNPKCWENWRDHFQAEGFQCLAPGWPGRDLPVDTLRKKHPDPVLGGLRLKDVVDHFTDRILTLHEMPILIGHSMGGLVVQLLLQKGIAAAGIAINSAPPAGVFTPRWSFLKANWPHLNPFTDQGVPIQMGLERFEYAFAHNLTAKERREGWERYIVPESRRVPRDSLSAKIDFRAPRPPLLLIAGGEDRIIPASLNRVNRAKYRKSAGITDYKEFPGRTHFIIGQKKWEEVADFIGDWIKVRTA
ncbi:MAG: alpha/beta hydrolase [Spirochaetes bacterium]|nr:alpha/beta hydrolase [Spirochaetota bacterium]